MEECIKNKDITEGYKVFKSDWTCGNLKYEVGEIYEDDIISFCRELKECFKYRSFSTNLKIAKIIPLGEINELFDESLYCTDKIKIVEEISLENAIKIINIGKNNTGWLNTGDLNTGGYNSGNCNSGHYNSSDYNSGNRNSGDYNNGSYNAGYWNTGAYNSGYWNIGHFNSGNYNKGDYNSGDYNKGNYNSGDYNNGSFNSGDWNKNNYTNGCFNTKQSKIFLFDKLSDWTLEDWAGSKARYILDEMPKNIVWIDKDDMTNREKERHPEYKTTGGYSKQINKNSLNKIRQEWWDSLSEKDRNIVKTIPNFDKDIFKEIIGIEV